MVKLKRAGAPMDPYYSPIVALLQLTEEPKRAMGLTIMLQQLSDNSYQSPYLKAHYLLPGAVAKPIDAFDWEAVQRDLPLARTAAKEWLKNR